MSVDTLKEREEKLPKANCKPGSGKMYGLSYYI